MSRQLLYAAPTPQPHTKPAKTHTHARSHARNTPVDIDVGAMTMSGAACAHEDSAGHTICLSIWRLQNSVPIKIIIRTGTGRSYVF